MVLISFMTLTYCEKKLKYLEKMLRSRPIRVSSQAEIQTSRSWGECGKVLVSSWTKSQMSWSRLEPEGLVYNLAKLPHNHCLLKCYKSPN